MRPYDAFLTRDEVVVADDPESGHLIASDRYVALDLAHATGPAPTAPGVWKISASKRPELVANPVGRYGDPAASYRTALDADVDWRPVQWSDYIRVFEGRPHVRIGSLDGEPIGVNADWLSRLPADWQLYAHNPDAPMLICRPAPARPVPVGIVMPIRTALRQYTRPTGDQVRNRRLDEEIARAHTDATGDRTLRVA